MSPSRTRTRTSRGRCRHGGLRLSAATTTKPALKLAKLLEEQQVRGSGAVRRRRARRPTTPTTTRRPRSYLTLADKAGKLDREGKNCSPNCPSRKRPGPPSRKSARRKPRPNDLPRVKLETSKGPDRHRAVRERSPAGGRQFRQPRRGKKFYDGLTFHRVLAGFMAQGGDPEGDGTGGPGYEIYCECHKPEYRRHFRGTLSMAHAGKDTGGSQFFLTFRPTTHLNGRHTAFGRVIEGLDVLAKLQRIDPERPTGVRPDKIVKAEVAPQTRPQVRADEGQVGQPGAPRASRPGSEPYYRRPPMQVAGQTFLVTGGASGLGAGIGAAAGRARRDVSSSPI